MSEPNVLEGLQALHGDLIAICEHRLEGLSSLQQSLNAHLGVFKNFLTKPPRKEDSRKQVQSGRIKVFDDEYSINSEFQQYSLHLADEVDLDEVEAAKILLESEEDQLTLGRPLLECGIIRFHQQRKYLLDCMRLCIQLGKDEDLEDDLQQAFGDFVAEHVFRVALPGAPTAPTDKKIAPRCMEEMAVIKGWLQKLSDRVLLAQTSGSNPPEFETFEFCRLSLIQQHENLAVILCAAIEQRHTEQSDFEDLLLLLKQIEKYDHLLVHLFPLLGAYIRVYGSNDGIGDLTQARALNLKVVKDDSWALPFLHAAARAWWIGEYTGWYVEGSYSDQGIDIDAEEKERTRQCTESLKEGAFDFILSLAADVATPEWQDPSRIGVRQWLQRKSPPLMTESIPFSEHFQLCLMTQLGEFIDAFITNHPDFLRKLRSEEDEQRQLSQFHEQDLDLERFLVIISYAFENRPEAAAVFWSNPDSHLAGFMQWASKRASTPLVCAFCEMLQAISENETHAVFAHEFLLDEGHHVTGKMRKSQSLTWQQIIRELEFFSNKIRDRPSPQQAQVYRAGKPMPEQAETEPESAMLLECYLRLMAKLASQSRVARMFLLRYQGCPVVDVIFQLTSCRVPSRLRACGFYALTALMRNKIRDHSYIMWGCVDSFVTGAYQAQSGSQRAAVMGPNQGVPAVMDAVFEEVGKGFEEPNAFIHLLLSLIVPYEGSSILKDALPFKEDIGASVRMPGIEPYVDFVLGHVFGQKSKELQELSQLRMLRLSCLDFALICLNTFNEDLIVFANETNIAVDSAIATTDLATYVRLHPFCRVMEWMFNGAVVDAVFGTIHQESTDIGSASPDSPLIQGIIRAVEVVSKVLELQNTYLDLVRPLVKVHSAQRSRPVPHAAYASFEEGIMSHLEVLTDLGRFCGLGHPGLTMTCLKLLEKISTSPRIILDWGPGNGRHSYRNKAIVALEKDGEAESISGSLIAELITPLDQAREATAPNYLIKMYILDFLYACLRATPPDQPTIAHLLLGFKCGMGHLSVEPNGRFDERTSLFHNLIRVLLEAPFGDQELGMRTWLVSLKHKILRILEVLWSARISSAIVLEELRRNDILFHLLLREEPLQGNLVWDGRDINEPGFLLSEAGVGFTEFLSMRRMTFEYVAIELCSVSQSRLPSLKRRIFDALNGQIKSSGDADAPMAISTIFELYDFLPVDGQWDLSPPEFAFLKDLDLQVCMEDGPDTSAMAPDYNIDRARQLVLLKRNEAAKAGIVISKDEEIALAREEVVLEEYLVFLNRKTRADLERRKVLTAWVNLLLVMFESSEHQGGAKVAFLLQVLQAILPSLETFGSERPDQAYELARLAKVLLYKLDFNNSGSNLESQSQSRIGEKSIAKSSAYNNSHHSVGNLISEKLFQLFEICLFAIGKRAGDVDLRAIYYAICYRYLTGIIDDDREFVPGRRKAIKAVQVYGEKLLMVICDDAFCGDLSCQAAALILLGAFANLGRRENDVQIVEALNRLNFIGILVDSLKTVLQDALDTAQAGNPEQQEAYQNAKLALILQLCQTRDGAKYVLQANLFRSIELSGLFAADPELHINPTATKALADHYGLLIRVARVIGAAILSRGAHNVAQGRRFLTDHRMLVMHVLKRSAGIGGGGVSVVDHLLEDRVAELADAFMVLITATGFLEFEDSQAPGRPPQQHMKTPVLFH